MTTRWLTCGGLASMCLLAGCATPRGEAPSANDPERPKTLLTWAGGKEAGENKAGTDKNEVSRKGGAEEEVDRPPMPRASEEPLASDRPDFTEASSTVGKGRVQLEGGYTFTQDGAGPTTSHSYPEALFRIGMIVDWLEFRIGQNFGNTGGHSPQGVFHTGGAEDLYLGVKLGLTEQKGVLPETALIVQTTVPSGHRDFTSGKVLPGLNYLFGWDVIEDRLTFGGSLQANRAVDADAHGYVEIAQSLTVGYGLTKKLGAYTEWFAFYPAGATAPDVVALHYFNGGFTYRLTPNIQLDIRAGLGLNRHADDFFAGTGFAVRY